MQGQRGRNERRAGVFLDVAHLILGIAIVIFAVLSIINPEGNEMLFPLVFLLAALLNGINGVFELSKRKSSIDPPDLLSIQPQKQIHQY